MRRGELLMFGRYDELERRYIGEHTPGWRWCLAPGCRSGQVHESVKQEEVSPPENKEVKQEAGEPERKGSVIGRWLRRSTKVTTVAQKIKPEPEVPAQPEIKPVKPDICTCNDCSARACVPCDRPWHENETCEEFQARVQNQQHVEEEDASLAAIQKRTRKCPQCSKSIEKNGGCRHMWCKSDRCTRAVCQWHY